MKNLLLLLSILFLSTTSYSQDKILKESTLPTKESKSFVWKDGGGDYVEVKFNYFLPAEVVFDKDVMDDVVMNILIKSKYSLKNKLTYVPVKLSLMESSGVYVGLLDFIGSNAYGVPGEVTGSFDFDLEGNLVEKGFY